jgi:hypothetical protein
MPTFSRGKQPAEQAGRTSNENRKRIRMNNVRKSRRKKNSHKAIMLCKDQSMT